MSYGTIKIDTITFTDGGIDKSVSVSGLTQNPTFSGNITVTGTISGNTLRGQTVSGVTITGTTAQFTSGTFTSLTGTTTQGTTATYTAGSFTSLTGTTTQGTTASFTTGTFTSLTGTTTTGTTATFATGVFSSSISGAVVTATSGVIASGTEANPSLSIVGDPNTGIYSPGADQVAISTNGTGRLFVDASGNVGFGVSSPERPIHLPDGNVLLLGTTAATGTQIQHTGSANFLINNKEAGAQIFYTNDTERLRITSDGRILAGYTSGRGATATQHIYGIPTGTSYFEIRNESTSGQGDILFSDGTDGNYGIVGYDHSTDAFRVYTASLERLRITSDGKLGLGTSTPAAPLHLMAEASGDGALIQRWGYVQADINNYYLTLKTGVSSGVVKYNFSMRNNGTDYNDVLVFDRGKVGIGITTPQRPLHIFTTDNLPLYVQTSDADCYLELQNSTGSGYIRTTGSNIIFEQPAGERARIDSSGRLLVGTSSDSGGALLQVNGNRIRIATAKTPASATDTGTAGEICWDADYVYVCTATNTWKRTAIATW